MTKIEQKKKYHRTDAWGRGFFEFDNSIYSSALLSGDAGNVNVLRDIDVIKTAMRKNRIPTLVKKTRTSNVFSTGVDVLVPQAKKKRADALLKKIKELSWG